MKRLAAVLLSAALFVVSLVVSCEALGIRRDYTAPTTTSSLMRKLDDGESASIWLTGDSTGNNSNEWFCLMSDWLADRYPAYSVAQLSWSDPLQAWLPTFNDGPGCATRVGQAGDRNIVISPTAYARIHADPAHNVAADLDVRAKIAPDAWSTPAAQTIAAKAGDGHHSWRVQLEDGRLTVEWSPDGTSLRTATSTATVPFGNGSPGWVRAAVDTDNGSGGSTVLFATSVRGDGWKQLGTLVTEPGTSGVFASAQDIGIGTFAGADPMVGKAYYLDVRDGIDGRPVALVDMDRADGAATTFDDYLGNTVELIGTPAVSGAPGISMFNGSVPGQTASYPGDEPRFTKLTPTPADLAFVNFGHNHGTAPSMRAAYSKLLTALATAWPDCRIVLVTQNPQTAPRSDEQTAAQAARMKELIELAHQARYGLVDPFTPMSAAPSTYTSSADGVHPTEAGDELWKEQAVGLFTTPNQ